MLRFVRTLPVFLLFLLTAFSSLAQPSTQDIRRAHRLSLEAKQLVRQGKSGEAVKRLREALKLHPLPSYQYALAKELVDLGFLVEAHGLLEKASAATPSKWREKQAVNKAALLFEDVKRRTPMVELNIVKPEANKVTVTIDGKAFDATTGPQPVDPGEHQLIAIAPGHEKYSKTLNLDEGGRVSLDINLPVKVGGGDDGQEQGEEGDDSGSGGVPKWSAYVTWGLGGAFLIIGTVSGIVAINQTNAVLEDYNCQDTTCPPQAEDDLSTAKSTGNLATASLVIGGVGVVLGTVLWFVADNGDEEPGAEPQPAAVNVKPAIGPGFVGLVGTF